MVLYYILLPLAWLVFHIGFRVHTVGRENLRKVQTKGCIIAPNHEKEGRLLPPKSGLFVIAAQAGVDVVPVRIRYDTPDGKMRLFCRVNVIYGEPMPAAQFAMESRRDMKVLRANKQALLDAWEQLK